jgi:hypothetical protein
VTLTTTAFTSNGNYAVAAGPNTRMLGLTGLTLTGNGGGAKNALFYRAGVITTNETWRTGITWVVGGVTIGSAGTLTIVPGLRVDFISQASLSVSGTLTAIGTSASPIVFTSNQAESDGRILVWALFSQGHRPAGFRTRRWRTAVRSPAARAPSCGSKTPPELRSRHVSNSSIDGVTVRGATTNAVLSDFTITGNALRPQRLRGRRCDDHQLCPHQQRRLALPRSRTRASWV